MSSSELKLAPLLLTVFGLGNNFGDLRPPVSFKNIYVLLSKMYSSTSVQFLNIYATFDNSTQFEDAIYKIERFRLRSAVGDLAVKGSASVSVTLGLTVDSC